MLDKSRSPLGADRRGEPMVGSAAAGLNPEPLDGVVERNLGAVQGVASLIRSDRWLLGVAR
jgi:hypothetical protein